MGSILNISCVFFYKYLVRVLAKPFQVLSFILILKSGKCIYYSKIQS